MSHSSSPSSEMPRSRPVSSVGSGFSRTRSLRLSRKPVHIPVPPSLVQSPYLTSPHSMFRRAISNPRIPSEADEEWLRDTIPLSWEGRDMKVSMGAARSLMSGMLVVVRRTTEEEMEATRGRSVGKIRNCNEQRRKEDSMSSPPLIRKRLPRASVPARAASWLQRTTSISHAAYPRSNSDSTWLLHS